MRYAPRFDLAAERYGPRIAAERIEDGRPVSLTFIACEPAKGSAMIDRLESFTGVPHKKVAELLELGACDGGIYLAQGETPARTIASVDTSTWELRQIVPVMSQVLAPLGETHARGAAVGAVLPNDVSLARKQGRDLHVKVANFGLAGALLDTVPPGGRAWCMAPELRASGQPSPAGDVYAVGALFAALLSGETPPTDGLAQWWAEGRVPAWRKAPTALVDAVAAMIATDPAARPADGTTAMEELIDAVPPALFKLPGTSTSSMPAMRGPLDPAASGTGIPYPIHDTGPLGSPAEASMTSSIPTAVQPDTTPAATEVRRQRSLGPLVLMAVGLLGVLGGALFMSREDMRSASGTETSTPPPAASPDQGVTAASVAVGTPAPTPTPQPEAPPPPPQEPEIVEVVSAEPNERQSDPVAQPSRAPSPRRTQRRRGTQGTEAPPKPAAAPTPAPSAPAPRSSSKASPPPKATSPLLDRSGGAQTPRRRSSSLLPPSE